MIETPPATNEPAATAVRHGDDEEIRQLLREICYITGMGFAAVARVTEHRWIACQVEDRIAFGIQPGSELPIQETICNEVRQCGQAVIIDDVSADPEWSTHPIPRQYGFQSYVSIPILLSDGSFFGTLCAMDPESRALSAPATVTVLEAIAVKLAVILSRPARNFGTGRT